jgi:hypothetical protein
LLHLLPNQALKLTVASWVQINIALRGFVLKENIRFETRFVLCKIKIGHAVA